jgi:hypothetical protein
MVEVDMSQCRYSYQPAEDMTVQEMSYLSYLQLQFIMAQGRLDIFRTIEAFPENVRRHWKKLCPKKK